MRSLTCIVCPIGCSLEADESSGLDALSVTGNKCSRGAAYAVEEIRAPKRTVTATCAINGEAGGATSVRRAPVKTSSPCPRDKISALLDDIYKVKITLPVKMGDIVIADWNGSKIDIVAARSLS
jgi:CxxC motif-containing protein